MENKTKWAKYRFSVLQLTANIVLKHLCFCQQNSLVLIKNLYVPAVFLQPEDVVVEVVVAGHGDHDSKPHTDGEEDL